MRTRSNSTSGRNLGLLLALSLSGCGSFLSESGPGRGALVRDATVPAGPAAAPLPYRLVQVDAATLPSLETIPTGRRFTLPPAADAFHGELGVGDDIGITIFESGPGGLFITDHPENQAGNSVTLPSQQIGPDGSVSVPYAGTIDAAGHTASWLQHAIEHRLQNRALEPQAVVSVLNRRSGMIDVTGDAVGTSRLALDPAGETLLDAITRAGGARFPDYETDVTIRRHGAIETARLSEIIARPDQDIALEPGDTIYLQHKPDYFMALGATGQATSLGPVDRRFAFGAGSITLADALGQAGGLEDDRANATAIFVYRDGHSSGETGPASTLPTIYLTDLRSPAGYFYASRFRIHPEDVVFVSNAPITDITKFLEIISPFASAYAGFSNRIQ